MKRKNNMILVLVCLLLVSIVACVCFSLSKGANYTDDYRIYRNVKNMEDTLQLLDYCHTNGIEYSIKNSKFAMEEYDVSFVLDKSECAIIPNEHMTNIEFLEKELYGYVMVSTDKNDDGSIVKTTNFSTLTHKYYQTEGSYRVVATWPTTIAIICSVVFGVALYFAIKSRNEAIQARRAQHNPNMD